MSRDAFLAKGWCRFGHDPELARWIAHVLPVARRVARAPENAGWLRCGGTWFVGVNLLPNDTRGTVDGGPALAGSAVDFIHRELGLAQIAWEPAQVSVCYPGYPQPSAEESTAAFRFRRDRDAAHLDGLLAEGTDKRRHLREFHGFVLGIPLVEASADASPLVVWEGSHLIIRAAFETLFAGKPPETWSSIDATETYQAARRRIFETCRRVAISSRPGEAYLLHRMALHGVAPWAPGATCGPDGRMIAYFRPETGGPATWLSGVQGSGERLLHPPRH